MSTVSYQRLTAKDFSIGNPNMTIWTVAIVREQGQTFAVVLVKDNILTGGPDRDKLINFWRLQLSCRVALLGERQFRSYGPHDIVRWLENVHPSQLPWREMSVAA
jgi:hypothetical protein